ncbi:carboxymuconolactone decarboxylase family protein [Streptomyces humidus]|uniref:carboxymuconolactone decarboxylase family protein n=1 Tax=Streptomyces humidus TaxID=52259 RepID=UPI003323E3AE
MTTQPAGRLDAPSPREMARAFPPALTDRVEDPLYSQVWADLTLSPRDRGSATIAAAVALHRPEELPAQLRRAVANGVARAELGALITQIAFYAGFPAAISASAIAAPTLPDRPRQTARYGAVGPPPYPLDPTIAFACSAQQESR